MPENWYTSRARVLSGLIESISLYAGVCLSFGGLSVLISHVFHANPLLWFSAGFSIPIGPLYIWLSSDRVLESRLVRWKRWKEGGLIGVGQYETLRRDALAWYAARHRFGRFPPVEAARSPSPAQAPPFPRHPSNHSHETSGNSGQSDVGVVPSLSSLVEKWRRPK